MKILNTTMYVVIHVETDGEYFNEYHRMSPDYWTCLMGDSEVEIDDCSELEAAYNEYLFKR